MIPTTKNKEIIIRIDERLHGLELVSNNYHHTATLHAISGDENKDIFRVTPTGEIYSHGSRGTLTVKKGELIITPDYIFRVERVYGVSDSVIALAKLEYQETIELETSKRINGIELEKIFWEQDEDNIEDNMIGKASLNANKTIKAISRNKNITKAEARVALQIENNSIIILENNNEIAIANIFNQNHKDTVHLRLYK